MVRRYHHIIDCVTGYPDTSVIATTVIAETCLRADILATLLFILGPKKGKEIVKGLGVKALWIDHRGQLISAGGFDG